MYHPRIIPVFLNKFERFWKNRYTRRTSRLRPVNHHPVLTIIPFHDPLRRELINIYIRQPSITAKHKHIPYLVETVYTELFFFQRGELILREKYSFGVFQLNTVGFEGILIKPVILNGIVDDLSEIPDVLLRAVVVALSDCLEIMLKIRNEGSTGSALGKYRPDCTGEEESYSCDRRSSGNVYMSRPKNQLPPCSSPSRCEV